MTLELLDEGAAGRTGQQIAEEKERLGAALNAAGIGRPQHRHAVGAERQSGAVAGADARHGAHARLRPAEVDRVRAQLLTAIAQAKKTPGSIAQRTLPPLLFGAGHPYATTALGDEAAIQAITRDDLIAFKQSWLRPDKAKLFVVSDRPLAEILPLLEAAFGGWQAPAVPAGTKDFSARAAGRRAGRGSSWSTGPIRRNRSSMRARSRRSSRPADMVPINAATDVFGGGTAARLSMDLRESKGWSYGAYGGLQIRDHAVPYVIQAPVQSDRTGEFGRGDPDDAQGHFERQGRDRCRAFPGGVEQCRRPARPVRDRRSGACRDDHQRPVRPAGQLLRAARRQVSGADPGNGRHGIPRRRSIPTSSCSWWSAMPKKVRPQLDKLGLPVEVVEAR